MDHHVDILELRKRSIGDGVQGLAGRIRDQVNVILAIHRSYPDGWGCQGKYLGVCTGS
jgi:hypothetical protein